MISILIKIIVSILLAIISVWWWDVGGKSLSCRMGFSWIFLSFSLTIFSALFASEDKRHSKLKFSSNAILLMPSSKCGQCQTIKSEVRLCRVFSTYVAVTMISIKE